MLLTGDYDNVFLFVVDVVAVVFLVVFIFVSALIPFICAHCAAPTVFEMSCNTYVRCI